MPRAAKKPGTREGAKGFLTLKKDLKETTEKDVSIMNEEITCNDGRTCPRGEYSEIILYEDVSLTKPTLILGFAGLGLVGSIAVNHLVSNVKDMRLVGHLESRIMPPIVPFYDGVLKQPFRVYYSAQHNLLVGFCEVPFKSKHYMEISNAVMHWALQVDVKDVVLLQGLAVETPFPPEEQPVYCAAEIDVFDKIKERGVELLPKGVIMGLEAAILINCLNSQLDGYALITPVTSAGIPSPEGAAALLEVLGQVYGIPLDLTELREEGVKIKNKLMELAQVAQNQMQRNASDSGMYGSGGTGKARNQFFV